MLPDIDFQARLQLIRKQLLAKRKMKQKDAETEQSYYDTTGSRSLTRLLLNDESLESFLSLLAEHKTRVEERQKQIDLIDDALQIIDAQLAEK